MTGLRILHCANFSEKKFGAAYYATDRKISNGLIRNGHMVHDFSYRDVARHAAPLQIKMLGIRKMNALLLETAKQVKPDLLLLGHSELVSNETLKEFRRQNPACKIAMWWVDPLEGFLIDKKFFEARIDFVDAFFLTTDPKELKAYLNIEKPLTNLHFMPNICDQSIDTGKAFESSSPRHDILFIGRKVSTRGQLIDFLQDQLADLDVGLYGQTSSDLILGHDYIDLMSHCPMAINFSRMNDISRYSSDRQVHLAANGCLTFTPETPNMKSVFAENEMVYFSDFADLREKIRYYQVNQAEAREIAMAGRTRALTDYECMKVSAEMLAAIEV